jgi:ABC-type Fe3+-hydroxamate transport system substrate-binding protein
MPRRWVTHAAAVVAAGLGAFALAGCSPREQRPSNAPPDSSRSASAGVARDDFGDTVVLGDSEPRRILSLDPAVTEILFALGAGPQLVGRTHWDLYSDSARALPDVGDGIRPNVEAVLATRPDLVFLYASQENRDAARALRRAGVNVVAVKIDRIDVFRRVTELAGRLTRREDRARAVVDSVSATLERVRQATAPLPRPTVLFHVWENPLLTIGRGSFYSELVTIAGGRNVFGDLADPSPPVAFEEVVRRDPDVVLVSPATARALRASPKWQALPAVREGRILEMDTVLVARPSVRLGEAAVSFARLLHPGLAL